MTDRDAARTAARVTAPALTAASRASTPPVPAVTDESVPAVPRGTAPSRADQARRAAARTVRVARRVRHAVPRRGGLTTVTAARRVDKLGRPRDTLFVYRVRRAWRFANSPAGVVLVVALCSAAAWVRYEHPGWVDPAARAGVVVLCGLGLWAGWGLADGLILVPHRTRWVNEMGYALRNVLDLPHHVPSAKIVRWPRDFGEAGTELRITLPRGWVGSDEELDAIVRVVHAKGGFTHGDLNHRPILQGPFSYLRFTPREKLVIPTLVRADAPETLEMLEQVRPGRPLLAIGRGGMQILGDLDGDAPHIGISMRTGGGKSNQLKGIIAQEMHLGASVIVCDLKRRSLKFLKGIEGVLYLREVDEIHHALNELFREADHRNKLADSLGDDEEPPWQRRLLVMEEQNSTLDELTDYWLQVREPGDPRVSPAVRSYRKLGNMGRVTCINILAVFQKMTAQAAGGTVARDNFGMVIMSKFKPSAWKMLAEDIPMPSIAGKPRGRNWYVFDGEAPEGQSLYWTDKVAREWASSGLSSAVRAYDPRGSRTPASQGERPANRAGTAIEVPERLYTLREASQDKGAGIVKLTYQSLRGRRSGSGRDPEFPEPDAEEGQKKLYRAETLQRWAANREAAA